MKPIDALYFVGYTMIAITLGYLTTTQPTWEWSWVASLFWEGVFIFIHAYNRDER